MIIINKKMTELLRISSNDFSMLSNIFSLLFALDQHDTLTRDVRFHRSEATFETYVNFQ